jgi:hypothetical protein
MFILHVLERTIKVIMVVVEFIIWDIISGWQWKPQSQPTNNTAKPWIDRATVLESKLRELDQQSQRRLEEAQNKFREEQKRKEREIDYLRSKH